MSFKFVVGLLAFYLLSFGQLSFRPPLFLSNSKRSNFSRRLLLPLSRPLIKVSIPRLLKIMSKSFFLALEKILSRLLDTGTNGHIPKNELTKEVNYENFGHYRFGLTF
jgi:hypothetical protein